MPAKISIASHSRMEMIDITPQVSDQVAGSRVTDGICMVYVPHTTAGVTINEGADPAVCKDILRKLNQLVPIDDEYRHMEGNSDSHIKASLIGSSANVIVENNRLILGTWQKIFFCEFDGPRSRNVYVKVI